MTLQPSTTEISGCIIIQETREWLTIFVIYAALVVLLALWAWPWLTFTLPMVHAEESWMWRAMLAGAMSVPVIKGIYHLEK